MSSESNECRFCTKGRVPIIGGHATVACSKCFGTGRSDAKRPRKCKQCQGTGFNMGACVECMGSGIEKT